MKKTSVIAINLKSFRIPAVVCTFAAAVSLCITLCNTVSPIKLSDDTVRWFLSSSIAFFDETPTVAGAYALIKNIPEVKTLTENTDAGKAHSTAENISVPSAVNPDSSVELSDTTDSGIIPSDYLSPTPSFLKEDFSVLIVHTHTTESYTPSERYSYIPTDTDRTTDKNYNMVRIGDEIENILVSKGIKVHHDTTLNDYPGYNGSYNRSAKIIEEHIKKEPSIKIVLDVHRDAIEGKNGEKIKHMCTIDGNNTAKIMFVTGSNISGLKHDNWEENLRFAVQLQKHIISLYPSLCRPINFRGQRFNQQLSPGSIIVEVGTNGNTLDEAISAARYFAVSLADYIEKAKGI